MNFNNIQGVDSSSIADGAFSITLLKNLWGEFVINLHNTYNEQFNGSERMITHIIWQEQNNSELSNFNKSYKYQQVQKVKLIGFSEHKWDISYQLLNYLKKINYTNGEYYLSLIYSFTTIANTEKDSNFKY
jgi:hypothetical protein